MILNSALFINKIHSIDRAASGSLHFLEKEGERNVWEMLASSEFIPYSIV